ncbi:MAG: DM13 domain-containing protein [Synechococcus sp.]
MNQSRSFLAAAALTAGSLAAIQVAMPPTASIASPAMLVANATARVDFRSAQSPVRGGFKIRRVGTQRLIELSGDFEAKDTAPDLKIAFSPSRNPLANSKSPAYPLEEGSYTVLAPLRSSSGAQSYVIPSSIDLERQGSVLIWCELFNSTMGWAPLQ